MTKKDLCPLAEPIKVNPIGVIFWAFIFALIFFAIGVATMHYPSIEAII